MSYPAPNYTQVPNILLDEHIQQMSDAELRVTLAIVRKTIGWQKRRDKISITQLEKLTGMSRQGVLNGVSSGLIRGTISRIPDGDGYIYELTISSEKVVNEVDQNKLAGQPSGLVGSQPSGLVGSQRSRPTKETVKESIKERALEHSFDWISDDDDAFALSVSEDRRGDRFGRADQGTPAEIETTPLMVLRSEAERQLDVYTGQMWDDREGWLNQRSFDELFATLLWCEVVGERMDQDPDGIRDPVGFIRAGVEQRKAPGLRPAMVERIEGRVALLLELAEKGLYTP
jgi:phage replication O-like protein O